VNNRKLIDYLFNKILKLDVEKKTKLSKAIDNYTKLSKSEFGKYIKEIGLDEIECEKVVRFMDIDLDGVKELKGKSEGADEIMRLFEMIKKANISNIEFKPYIVR